MPQPWPLALGLLVAAQVLAAWSWWRGRRVTAATWGGLVPAAALLLTWRQMSPGTSLQPLEWGFVGGNLIAVVMAIRAALDARTGPPGFWAGRWPLLALWLWNAACIALLAWLATRFRLFG